MLHILLALALFDPGQESGPPQECVDRSAACRRLQEYELRVGDGSVMIDGGAVLPWVQDGRLLLFVGESAVAQVDRETPVVESSGRAAEVLNDARLEAMAAMMEGVTDELPRFHTDDALRLDVPDGRVRTSFLQVPGSAAMILTVENGYEGALNYRATMMTVSQDGVRWERTSVCTVGPGIYSLEHWPYPIVALALDDFELASKDEPVEVVCR